MPEHAVSITKHAVNTSTDSNIELKLDYEAALFGILQSEKDTKERIDKFMQKKRSK